MKARQLIILFLCGSLGSPKSLSFQALILSLESMHNRIPGHGSKFFVHFVVTLDGFQIESKHITFQETWQQQEQRGQPVPIRYQR
jgi:hypothetical protein